MQVIASALRNDANAGRPFKNWRNPLLQCGETFHEELGPGIVNWLLLRCFRVEKTRGLGNTHVPNAPEESGYKTAISGLNSRETYSLLLKDKEKEKVYKKETIDQECSRN